MDVGVSHPSKWKCKHHTSIYTKLSHPYIQCKDADIALFHICKIDSSIYSKYGCKCHLLPYLQNYLIRIFKSHLLTYLQNHLIRIFTTKSKNYSSMLGKITLLKYLLKLFYTLWFLISGEMEGLDRCSGAACNVAIGMYWCIVDSGHCSEMSLPASNRVNVSHRDPVDREGGVSPQEEQGELLEEVLHSLVLILTNVGILWDYHQKEMVAQHTPYPGDPQHLPPFPWFTPHSCGSPFLLAVPPFFLQFTLFSCGSPLFLVVHFLLLQHVQLLL